MTEIGKVASLHLHPQIPGEPLTSVEFFDVAEQKGIVQNGRYFERKSRSGGPSRRQVSLIEREQLAEHAAALGLMKIAPGAARANLETTGIQLNSLIGKKIQIGEAILLLYELRTPCHKMDLICGGLRQLMQNGKQGALAQVIHPGRIHIGDSITLCPG